MQELYIHALLAVFVAAIVALCGTPLVGRLAELMGAIDVPQDDRRMHKKPIPRLGGLAIFAGFLTAVLFLRLFTGALPITMELRGMLIGSILIVVVGIIDDVLRLPAWIKLIVQIAAAGIAVWHGLRIEFFANPFNSDAVLYLGVFSIPVTMLWIAGITNAVNFIDGLDGLSVGVSAIGSISIFIVAAIHGEPMVCLLMAALAGGSLGFLPYNFNPAKMFVGDNGATFLGFILGSVSVMGLFKFTTVISFVIPFLVLGLPLFDLLFSVVRRIASGKSPAEADGKHVHHRLIDMGFSQKQAVTILYAISAALGITAVLATNDDEIRALLFAAAVLVALVVAVVVILKRSNGGDEG
jgi:UDP-GlcNAc:undecaprenyl-phosphate GlcNAc-1-phosphate transferase